MRHSHLFVVCLCVGVLGDCGLRSHVSFRCQRLVMDWAFLLRGRSPRCSSTPGASPCRDPNGDSYTIGFYQNSTTCSIESYRVGPLVTSSHAHPVFKRPRGVRA